MHAIGSGSKLTGLRESELVKTSTSNKSLKALLKLLGKRLKAGQPIHFGIFTNMLLPRFFGVCEDDAAQQSNAQKIIAVVGQPMEWDHGALFVEFLWSCLTSKTDGQMGAQAVLLQMLIFKSRNWVHI